MGTYYSAARDPIFYLLHHANSEVWLELDLDDDDDSGNRPRHADFTDPDWLDSSFLFYDEDARLVRVTVRDMLDMGRLRYTYGEVDMPWLKARPLVTPNLNRGTGPHRLKSVSIRFPVWLDGGVTAQVRRPGEPRSQQEEKVLVVEGIKAHSAEFVKFDVYMNAVDHEKVGPGGREMPEASCP
jgi:polyphenol oxidase